MKPFKKFLSMSALLMAMALTACNGGGQQGQNNDSSAGDSSSAEQGPEKREGPMVFVLSGQSNMEGQTNVGTNNSYLTAAFDALGITDGDECITGIESVLTSFYGCGYGELDASDYNNRNVHASNTQDKIKGQFFPTKVGMGANDSQMGPELGCAYALKDYATAENPIYFVKMASSGSGFAQSGNNAVGKNWEVKTEDGEIVEHNLFSDFLKPFLQNNLDWIEEETGQKPVIKAWLWHQGESDAEEVKRNAYARRLADMIEAFRTEFADYSEYEDDEGKSIAFIDGMPYEGGTMLANAESAKALNEIKLAAADPEDNRYIVDNYANEEHTSENELKVSGDGATSGVHYNTKDSFRLGMAYGKVIIDNLLEE